MLKKVLICAALAALTAAPAQAQSRVLLMPGVTYERQVQFTSHGPVAVHVLNAPRPGGSYALKPVLSNGAILGRDRVTAMQRGVRDATAAGVNGDLFTWTDGRPSGMLMQDGVARTTRRSRSGRRSASPATARSASRSCACSAPGAAPGSAARWISTRRPARTGSRSSRRPGGRRRRSWPGAVEAVVTPLPRDDAERRPQRADRGPGTEREHADPARRRRPRRARHRGAAARSRRRRWGRTVTVRLLVNPDIGRRRARDRRRPGARARRQAGLPRQRAVLDRAAGAEPAHRRGAARRRPRS